ncbi:putative ABC transport system permease protein [Bifidobacterium commune]|uniref:Putative ABC transport system permease protein n=1 Tax=Bifidobacterium commune TaxID=1505727 RepID=A0A1C4H2X4_9BIFI|nr:FtsX-like permease family protein [Bifidobacterium commune]MBB2955005.1 putative ABC transport system permease protein [Bifidobacterium commune]SCC79236.1 putative ABC transport system permease protein [Bifidobacterium commune]
MFSVTLKLVKKSGKILIPAGIAILIGTAFIAATFLFGNSIDNALRSQVTATLMQADYVVMPKDADKSSTLSSSSGDESVTVSSNGDDASKVEENPSDVRHFKFDQVSRVDGVSATQVMIDGNGTVKRNDDSARTVFGLGSSDKKLQAVQISKGHSPLNDNEVAVPMKMADRLHLQIGDTVTLGLDMSGSGDTDEHGVKVVGLTSDAYGEYSMYGGVTLVAPQVYTKLCGAPSFADIPISGLLFDVDSNKDEEAVKQVKAILGKDMNVERRDQIAEKKLKDMAGTDSSPVKTFLMVFGVLSLFVAALVIANTFRVMIAQRRRTLALLRTIGAKKGQLYCSVLFEAGVLGLIASSLGILVASGLMGAFSQFGPALGYAGPPMKLIVTWQVVVIPLVFGVVMTVLASLGSARSATAVTPLEALRPLEITQTRKAGTIRAVLGVLMIVFGVVCCGFGASRIPSIVADKASAGSESSYYPALLSAMAGCALIFIGLTVTAAFWLPLLMHGIGALTALVGPSAKIANANIQKNPRRIASTGVALMIGVTLVSTIATGAACGKKTIDTALDSHYGIDMLAEGRGLSRSKAERVSKVSGISDTLYLPTVTAHIKQNNGKNDLPVLLVGVKNKDSVQKVMRADISSGTIAPDTVLIPRYDERSGHKLSFANNIVSFSGIGANGGVELPAMKTTQVDYRNLTTAYSMVAFVDESTLAANNITANGHVLFMKFDDNPESLNDVFEGVENVLDTGDDINITGPGAQRVVYNMIIDVIMKMVIALLAVSVLIALIGVVNTLSLSVIERTRESATLRAIGMTRGQLKRSLACEALLIALVSGLIGVVLGTVFGWFGSYMVFSLFGDVVYIFDWKFNGAVLLIAALAAWASSVIPARRAVKTPPVEALAEA